MTEGQRVTDAQVREEFLRWLPRPGEQVPWMSFVKTHGYDKAQVERVCIQMVRRGEIVNAHTPSEGELATHVKRPQRR